MPDWTTRIRPRLSSLRLAPAREQEIVEELAQHLEDRWRELVAGGTPEDEAERLALAGFREGNLLARHLAPLKQAQTPPPVMPGASTGHRLRDLWQDVRHAARGLRKQPAFALATIVTLAIGIGANAAVFTVADQALLRPLPVERPDQLVLLNWNGTFIGGSSRGGQDTFAYPTYLDLRAANPGTLAGLAARHQEPVSIGLDSGAERGLAELVSGSYFDVLGVRTQLGRTLGEADDDERGGDPYVVLSHAYWLRRFGGDPSIVNRTLRVNGYPLTIVGVAQPGFGGVEPMSPADMFVPIAMKTVVTPTWDDRDRRDSLWLNIVGRLAPGLDVQAAAIGMAPAYVSALRNDLAGRARATEFSERYLRNTLSLERAGRGMAPSDPEPLYILLAMVAILLLASCANVAGLVVARAARRRREMAVRASLGASRAALLRLAMVESLLLAAAGGGVGLLAAGPMARGLVQLLPSERIALAIATAPDWRIVAFTTAVSLVTALVFGLAPALQASLSDPLPSLKSQGTTTSINRSGSRFRRALVAAQVGLSVLLLISAGLFARHLKAIFAVDPGIETARIVSLTIDPSHHRYTPQRSHQLALELQQRLRQIPRAADASGAAFAVLRGWAWQNTIDVEGHEPPPNANMQAYWNQVLPGFFATLGVRLLAGRDLTDADTGSRSVIVNETLARRFFGSAAGALGHRVGFGGRGAALDTTRTWGGMEIVGVVEDMKGVDLNETSWPATFTPALATEQPGAITFYVRADGEPESLVGDMRRAVRSVDPALAVYDLRTLDEQVEDTHFGAILVTRLSTVFAALATLLAAVGLYGVAALAAACRTQEFGVRITLGASRAHVLILTLRELLWVTGAGVVAGVPTALAVGWVARSRVTNVDTFDPIVAVSAIAIIVLVSLVAGAVPARRAARLDPIRALRHE